MNIDTTSRQSAAPKDFAGPRIPLYTPEFAADPHAAYAEMRRRFGVMAPVELAPGVPATLVLEYHTALRIRNDPSHFPNDPRRWQRTVPADCPVLPMMGWRPNPLFSADADHVRYRSAVSQALDRLDMHRLHTIVEGHAIPLINSFCGEGYFDVIAQYAMPIIFATLNDMLGCPVHIAQRSAAGMAAMFEGGDEAIAGNEMLMEALTELIHLKRAQPGDDVTSWLIEHPVGLDDEEMRNQLSLLYGAGIEPPQNLIANTLLLMLTDERFGAGMLGGSLSTRDALDEVLFNDPPMANYCTSYPRQPILIDGVWLPADQPVVISMAACNNDPAIRTGNFNANSSHLAFGAGPHACPARPTALLIVQDAIDQLLDALPDLELAVAPEELQWRPGPFHRALVSLPVSFPPSPPIHSPSQH